MRGANRDDRSCAEPEKAAGARGVQKGAQVFDLSAQPVELTVWPAPATTTPVRHVDRERPGKRAGKPGQIPRRLTRSVQEDDRRAGADSLVGDGCVIGGAHLTKRRPRIYEPGLLLHRADATPGPGGQQPVQPGRLSPWVKSVHNVASHER